MIFFIICSLLNININIVRYLHLIANMSTKRVRIKTDYVGPTKEDKYRDYSKLKSILKVLMEIIYIYN